MGPFSVWGTVVVVAITMVVGAAVAAFEDRMERAMSVGRGRKLLSEKGRQQWTGSGGEHSPTRVILDRESGSFAMGDVEVEIRWSEVLAWKISSTHLVSFFSPEWTIETGVSEVSFRLKGFDGSARRQITDGLLAVLPPQAERRTLETFFSAGR